MNFERYTLDSLHTDQSGIYLKYFYISIILFISIFAVDLYLNDDLTRQYLAQFILGFGIGMLLIFIHEGIHALGFLYFGYSSIKFKSEISKGLWMTYVDSKVAPHHLKVVALLPFFVISICMVIMMLTFPQFRFIFYGTILMHVSYCKGDFILASFIKKDEKNINSIQFDQSTKTLIVNRVSTDK